MSRVDVELGVKNAGFRTGLAQAEAAVGGLEKKWSGLMKFGALGFSAGAAVAGLKSIADEFDRINDLSVQLGQTPETIQRLGNVSKLAGTDIELMAKALAQAYRLLSDTKNTAAIEAAASLSIETGKFLSLNAEGRLALLSDAYKNAADKGKAFSDLTVLLGKATKELIPALDLGGDQIDSLASSISVLSDQSVKDIAEMNDTFDTFFTNLKVWTAQGITGLGHFAAGVTDDIIGLDALLAAKAERDSAAKTAALVARSKKAASAARRQAAIDAPTGAEAFGLRVEALQPLWDAINKTKEGLALGDSPLADQLAAAEAQLKALKDGFLDLEAGDARTKATAEILALTKEEYDLRKKIAEQDAAAVQATNEARADAIKQESAARDNWTAQALAEVEAINTRIAAVQGSVNLGSLRAIGGGSNNVNLDAESGLTAKLSKQADDARATYADLRKSSEALAASVATLGQNNGQLRKSSEALDSASKNLGKSIIIPAAQFRGT